MATVHLMCGLPGSGKTTAAQRIEVEQNAFRFTLDQWMLQLFDLTPFDAGYGPAADRVKELIWDIASMLVARGQEVVLDWSQWSRTMRSEAKVRVDAMGATAALHYVNLPLDTIEQRLRLRNATRPPGAHHIDADELRRFATELFEPPTDDEGLSIVLESP
jgi:predicted kinase